MLRDTSLNLWVQNSCQAPFVLSRSPNGERAHQILRSRTLVLGESDAESHESTRDVH